MLRKDVAERARNAEGSKFGAVCSSVGENFAYVALHVCEFVIEAN